MANLINKRVRYENWKWREFGYCPACGAIGFEQYPSMESDKVEFICSRYCWTNYPHYDFLANKAIPRLRIHGYTMWSESKPKWWRKFQKEEASPYSWNWERLSQTCCLRHDLV